jgi:Tol biopolymer transport system component
MNRNMTAGWGIVRRLARGGRRPLTIMLLAAVAATTACNGAQSPPSATATASPRFSASPTTAPAPSSAMSPAPLPEGRLAYGRFSPDGTHVFTAKTDGTDETALVSSSAEGPRWSPDGRHLSVVAESPQGLVFVGLVNPDGSDYLQFDSPDPTLNLGCFAWSPDASRLACEGWDETDLTRNGIYTVRASDGGDVKRVTTDSGGGHDIPGDYSPDGRQIVFIRSTNLSDEEHSPLMVVDVDGSHQRSMTDRKVGLACRWSPDGKTILTELDGSLLLVPIDGSKPSPIKIEADATVAATRGAWSTDGAWIVFSRVSSAGEDIYIMRTGGTDLHQVTDTPGQNEEFGDWGMVSP